MYLGMALHQLGDTDNAVAAYDKAVSLGPAEPLLLLNYGERVCRGWWCSCCTLTKHTRDSALLLLASRHSGDAARHRRQ